MTVKPSTIRETLVASLDLLMGIGVVGLITFATAAFGTVKPWSEWYVILMGACIAGLLALRVMLAEGLPRTAAYAPIVAYLAIVVFQMISLPAWLVGAVSPRTLADKSQLLADLPGAAARLRHMTISYYLGGTYHDLRLVLLDVAIFLVVLTIARTSRRMMALLVGFSIVAAALAGLALLQDFLHAPNIMWINGADTRTWAGPFVNHSDFSQQMNHLCGWTLALLLVIAGGAWQRGRWQRGWRIAAICLLAIVFIGGFIATLFCLSRGGIVCAILAGALVMAALASRRGRRSQVWLVVVIGCVALSAALCTEFTGIYNYVLSVSHGSEYAERLTNVKDILSISRQYPLLGSGLGTHLVFFPRFETFPNPGTSTHAEVEYAQVIEETGYLGLACVLLFCAIVWVHWKRAVANATEPIAIAAVGLGFGLAAVQLQSFSDFGQHLPSLGCLTAVTCAMLINLGRLAAAPKPQPRRGWVMAMTGRAAFAAVMLAGGIWCAVGAQRAKVANARFNDADATETFIEDNPWFRTPRSNSEVLAAVSASIEANPTDIWYPLMQGWYRYTALITPLGPGSPGPSPDFVPSVTIDPNHPDLAKVQEIVNSLNEARWICPTFGQLYTFVGDMELDPLHEPIGAAHIRLGAELAPHDAHSLELAAQLDARDGLWDESARLFGELLDTWPDRTGDVVSFYVNQVHRPDLALAVRPNDYGFLQLLASSTTDRGVQQAAGARMKELLVAACDGPNPTGDQLAALATIRRGEGDLRAAADLYKRAIALNYSQVPWHLALAQVLLQTGDRAGAQAEAGICLRLQPGLHAAQDVLDALSTVPPQ